MALYSASPKTPGSLTKLGGLIALDGLDGVRAD